MFGVTLETLTEKTNLFFNKPTNNQPPVKRQTESKTKGLRIRDTMLKNIPFPCASFFSFPISYMFPSTQILLPSLRKNLSTTLQLYKLTKMSQYRLITFIIYSGTFQMKACLFTLHSLELHNHNYRFINLQHKIFKRWQMQKWKNDFNTFQKQKKSLRINHKH